MGPAALVLVLPGMAYPSCEKVARVHVLFNLLILALVFSATCLQQNGRERCRTVFG